MLDPRRPTCLTARNLSEVIALRFKFADASCSARTRDRSTVCALPQILESRDRRRRAEDRSDGHARCMSEKKMHAEVELVAARFEGDRLRYLVGRHACAAGLDPDETARTATTRVFPEVPLRRIVVHSTSWRYEHGSLLLTYLAYSDDLPFHGLPDVLPREGNAVGAGVASVVAHAIRHLAFLVREEPDRYGRALSTETLAHLERIEPKVAGRIYGERAA